MKGLELGHVWHERALTCIFVRGACNGHFIQSSLSSRANFPDPGTPRHVQGYEAPPGWRHEGQAAAPCTIWGATSAPEAGAVCPRVGGWTEQVHGRADGRSRSSVPSACASRTRLVASPNASGDARALRHGASPQQNTDPTPPPSAHPPGDHTSVSEFQTHTRRWCRRRSAWTGSRPSRWQRATTPSGCGCSSRGSRLRTFTATRCGGRWACGAFPLN